MGYVMQVVCMGSKLHEAALQGFLLVNYSIKFTSSLPCGREWHLRFILAWILHCSLKSNFFSRNYMQSIHLKNNLVYYPHNLWKVHFMFLTLFPKGILNGGGKIGVLISASLNTFSQVW